MNEVAKQTGHGRGVDRRHGLILFGASLACGPAPIELVLGEDVGSVIVASLGAEEPVLDALSIEDPRARSRELPAAPARTTYVLAFNAPLSDLGLPAGSLELRTGGGPLPPANRIFEFDLEAPEVPVEHTTMPVALASVRLAATDPCVRFESVESWTLPNTENLVAAFVERLDEDRVIASLQNGSTYVVSSSELMEIESAMPGRTLVTGVVDARGELWVADTAGEVVHGHPDRGFVSGPTFPRVSMENFRFVSSPPSAEPELYAVTSSLAVFKLEGETWLQLRAPSGEAAGRSRHRLGWLAPGRVALIGTTVSTVLEISVDGSVVATTLTIPNQPTEDTLFEIGWIEAVGAIIGTRYDTLYKRAAEGWELLPLPPATPIVYILIDLGDGHFLAGGENGQAAVWPPDRGQCPAFLIPAARGNLRWAAPIRDGFVTFADRTNDVIEISRYVRQGR